MDDAVVAEFGQFLDAQAGGTQDCATGPGPEAAVFFEYEVAAVSGAGVVGPDPCSGIMCGYRAAQPLARGGEFLSGNGGLGGGESFGAVAALRGGGVDEGTGRTGICSRVG